MNIPPDIARAQGHHGFKGAPHGHKGGRPKLDLTPEQRSERRRQQHEGYRRKKGIPARSSRPTKWPADYIAIWGRPPGVPLSPEEFAGREPLWNQYVAGREAEMQPGKPQRKKGAKARKPQPSASPPPPIAATPRTGRNQPCPCGSGRKSKKCCGGG